ncbi:MAG: hypothetical protein WAR57_13280 [Candidatus Phosphoribacter sp.]
MVTQFQIERLALVQKSTSCPFLGWCSGPVEDHPWFPWRFVALVERSMPRRLL